jgi:hypothetical protein
MKDGSSREYYQRDLSDVTAVACEIQITLTRMAKIHTERDLMQLCNRNRDGSFSTQAARRDILSMAEHVKIVVA